MSKNRPVYLSFVGLPITAMTSISHRIMGIVMFASLPILLVILQSSLQSEESFNSLKAVLSGWFPKLVLWAILSAWIFHFVAGVRHLIMDMGIGETLEGGRMGSMLIFVFSAILIVAAGVWICLPM